MSLYSSPVGIIAGRGKLPSEIAKFHIRQGGSCYIAAIAGEADPATLISPYRIFPLGSIGEIIDYFQKAEVKYIVFAGGVNRPNLSSVKVDFVGAKLLAQIFANKFLGDDTILKVVINFCERSGFKVLSMPDIYPQATSPMVDALTSHTVTPSDMLDIELGVKLLTILAPLDVGQSVVIEESYILGIEAAEGTDNLIKRCAILRKKPEGAILIKALKQGQDIRIDVPTIGLQTIDNLVKHRFSGLAIQKGKVLIIQPEEVIEYANRHGIFIIAVDIKTM